MIRPSEKYGEADLVEYTLRMIKNIDFSEELATYTESVNCNDFDKWIIPIREDRITSMERRLFIVNRFSKKRNVYQGLKMQGKKQG